MQLLWNKQDLWTDSSLVPHVWYVLWYFVCVVYDVCGLVTAPYRAFPEVQGGREDTVHTVTGWTEM